eukprot:TRINITY_DN64270_c0_g1_i1.p1 TRINITY_DN64270_c0_g1~~TRINITY_DN64270_c0_g1_i1.p1  ORF type:complete len:506 (-),score=77.68 TRINITY_DN64270_c0_g1_i1:277-1734(-)
MACSSTRPHRKWFYLGGEFRAASGERTSDPGHADFPADAWFQYSADVSWHLSEAYQAMCDSGEHGDFTLFNLSSLSTALPYEVWRGRRVEVRNPNAPPQLQGQSVVGGFRADFWDRVEGNSQLLPVSVARWVGLAMARVVGGFYQIRPEHVAVLAQLTAHLEDATGQVQPPTDYPRKRIVMMVEFPPGWTEQAAAVQGTAEGSVDVQVLGGLAGNALLGPVRLPLPLRAESIWERLHDVGVFDKLLDGDLELPKTGEVPLALGRDSVVLTLVRVEIGLLAVLDEATAQALIDCGAVQDSPPGLLGSGHCLSLSNTSHHSMSGGGFGKSDARHHVMLTGDGRILVKYWGDGDYMERNGEYNASCNFQIAEGTFTVEGPAQLSLQWSAWAEAVGRTQEMFARAMPGPWEAKVVDEVRKPHIMVPTNRGVLDLNSLCAAWATEKPDRVNIEASSQRSRTSIRMPNLNEEVLHALGFNPQHLPFWMDGD